MVDASNLKPGDRVRLTLANAGKSMIVPGSQTASGMPEHARYGDVFTVADPSVSTNYSRFLMLEWTLGKNCLLECPCHFLDYVTATMPVNAIQEMRNAGPPAPTGCTCDFKWPNTFLGCRCGAAK